MEKYHRKNKQLLKGVKLILSWELGRRKEKAREKLSFLLKKAGLPVDWGSMWKFGIHYFNELSLNIIHQAERNMFRQC